MLINLNKYRRVWLPRAIWLRTAVVIYLEVHWPDVKIELCETPTRYYLNINHLAGVELKHSDRDLCINQAKEW